jgi:hypothetical protein
MSKTPVRIIMRADEWQEIAASLNFLAETCDEIAFVTSAMRARKFANEISKRVKESS